MPKNVNPFVFNDETVANHYGFFIMTEGIDLSRFINNPVMLEDHCNEAEDVLGKWIDIKKESGILSGIPEFDTADEEVQKIAGKVDRGYIRACSMGIVFDTDDMIFLGGNVILQKCELVEVSIVAVPSNRNSIQLYKTPGVPFENEEIQRITLALSKNENLNLNPIMKKIMLSISCLMALGFLDAPKEGVDESELESKVLGLSNKLKAMETENQSLKTANLAMKEAQEAIVLSAATEMVTLAITQGKIGADKKETFLELAKANLSLAKQTLDSIPAKVNLGGNILTPQEASAVATMDDFQKLDQAAQLSFKNDNPEAYKKLFA